MSFWAKLARTFQPQTRDDEIEEELRYHVEMKARDGYEARAARVKFGNRAALKEETRAQGILTWLESLAQDTRYACRQLRKAPVVTGVVVISLAVGIGANSGIYSLVDAALIKPLPVKNPQLLRIVEWAANDFPGEPLCSMHTGDTEHLPGGGMRGSSMAARIYRELAKDQNGFASLIGFSDVDDGTAVGVGKRPSEQMKLQYISTNFFASLGVPLQMGRAFSPEDDRVGQAPVVIVSDRFWREWLAGRSDVLGQTIRVNNVPVEIAGVAPPGFFGIQIGEWVDLYAPLAAQATLNPRMKMDQSYGENDAHWWVRTIGRLKPQVSELRATAELSALFQHLVVPPSVHVNPNKIPKLITSPGQRGFDAVGSDQARALWILLLLVGLILSMVCANVANLLLSRAVARQRESAVCLALGAGRFRLLRRYLIESFVLAILGGFAGVCLSRILANAIHAFLRADLGIGGFDLHIDSHILIFTSLVSLLTALLFGIAPAWQLARARVNDALKANSRTVLSGRLRLPRLLVVLQIGLSFTVLAAAGLLARSLTILETSNIGFNRANLVYVSVNPWSAGDDPDHVGPYVNRVRDRLTSIPGVLRVSMIEERPLSGAANETMLNMPGHPYVQDEKYAVLMNHVSDGLFETLGIPLLAGRTFDKGDMRANSIEVVVDELFAQRYYPNSNAVGQEFGTGPAPKDHFRIIGVVKNSLYNSLRKTDMPVMFLPSATGSDYPGSNVNFVLRSALDVRQLTGPIHRAIASIDAGVPITSIKTQTALIDHLLLVERLLSILSGAFGALALVLSVLGLVGLLVYTIARRRNEIGIRMAVGATEGDVIRLVLKDSLWLVAAGVALGLPGAFLVSRLLQHILFKLSPSDPSTAAGVLLILASAGALAAWGPARRASRIDPMIALRDE